eukprot:CAMPEP_0174735962 /NCGR_PEP_ID=MMETSP1094-20130205/65870_1 /TAXON_ID=156173 /ORGANISM="Chrysochromulina brevifilum, Strain UTEX LB 985" /LENGTH=63 /DNA_ID=CAMNT_0015938993 /DNA_START=29 /DNA_END=217 /DNA_ORIENTATION=+
MGELSDCGVGCVLLRNSVPRRPRVAIGDVATEPSPDPIMFEPSLSMPAFEALCPSVDWPRLAP